MNKTELIQKLKDESDLNTKQITDVLDNMIDIIEKEIKSGESVRILGFGTFEKTFKPARTGRNPRTGESINIPAVSSVKFKPGKEFKKFINM